MCGICGFVDGSGSLDHEDLRRMNETIRRRGPDDDGFSFGDGVGLAMRRLSVLDLDGSPQPLENEDGSIRLVFNGEIYNYRELREGLLQRGHTLRTEGDGETLVHLYEEHGPEFIRHLRGMFAFALWDRRDGSVLVARDRLGIKPMYYAQSGSTVIFGSEIKALLASNRIPRDVDWQAIDAFLTFTYIPAPYSAYRAIRKLPPGHWMRVHDGQLTIQRYWDPDFSRQEQGLSEADWEERIQAKVADAVRSHLVSDVPLGAFLSGGIDSSLVVAMMAEASDKPVETFTMGFAGEELALRDERPYARMVATRYGAQVNEFTVQPDLTAILDEIVDAFDEPFADDSVVPSYYISKLTRQKVTVALSGLGGDELFGGYHRYRGFLLSGRYRVPAALHRGVVLPLIELIPEPRGGADRIDHLKRFARSAALAPAERYLGYVSSLAPEGRRRLYRDPMLREVDFERTAALITEPFAECGSDDLLDRVFYTDLKTYLPEDILALSDRLSMWHSLELRVPLIDHELTELALRMPSRFKVRTNSMKHLLKRVAANKLPPEIIHHRKQGFESPMAAWLRGELREFAGEILLDPRVEDLGYLRRDEIQRLWDAHQDGREKNNKILFSLLMLLSWLRRDGVL